MGFVDDLNPEFVMFAGDWHGYLNQADAVISLMENSFPKTNVIVQLGDFGIWPSTSGHTFLKRLNEHLLERDMWCLFVDGNHESYDILYKIPPHVDGHRVVKDRIIHLPRGFRWNWQGIRFAALGGAYSVDQKWRIPGKSWWSQELVTDAEIQKFISGGPADVVVTHDVPDGAPMRMLDDPIRQLDGARIYGYPAMQQALQHRQRLATAINPTDPALILHGHYHERTEGRYVRPGGRPCHVIGLDEGGGGVDRNALLFDLIDFKAGLDI